MPNGNMRSFKRVNTRGRTPQGGPEDGNGDNSLGRGPRSGSGPGTQNDASSGMVRQKSQAGNASYEQGKGSRKAPPER